MNLNPSKCHVLNIHRSTSIPTFNFKINNLILPKTEALKDLGFFISGNLKWNHHINYIYRTASILSFQILKSFISTDLEILKKLYLVYIRPKIEYNTPLWSPCSIKDINQLEPI